MKKVVGALIFILFTLQSYAQYEMDYWRLKKQYLEENKDKFEAEKGEEDGERERFNRWTWFMENRIDQDTGSCFDPGILWREKTKFLNSAKKLRNGNSDWVSLGPTSPYDVNDMSTGRLGRVNCLTIHPNDTNKLYLGAPDGGIWVSNDAGVTWTNTTDFLDNISITDILIHPTNTNIMYAATGDGYGYYVNSGFWGGTYSNGVIKSLDGGVTWQSTGLSHNVASAFTIRDLAFDPTNPDIIYASTSGGLLKSTDAGATWITLLTGGFYNVEFNPANPGTMYAVSNALRKSTDSGATWTLITPTTASSNTGDIRNYLAVCHGDTNKLYYFFGKQDYEELFVSNDGGSTWTNITAGLAAKNFKSYGYYAAVMRVNPNNDNHIVVGGIYLFESINGGTVFNEVGPYNLHADHRCIEFSKSQPNLYYIGCDGGLYCKRGNNLKMISEGLVISQIYNITINPFNYQTFYVGLQDNGNKSKKGNIWVRNTGGDGMENLVDLTDTNHTYHTIQFGELYESFDGGYTTSPVNNSAPQEWILPLLQEEEYPFEIYQGGQAQLVNLSTAQNIPVGLGNLKFLEASKRFKKHWITSNGKKIWSTQGGPKGVWKDITGSLVSVPNNILDIACGNNDSNTVYAVYGGFSAGKRVYRTLDNGVTWENYTANLPNIPINTVVEGRDSFSTVYVGTDFGVFYRDKYMTEWLPFNKNLPNVIVTDLRIADDANYIFAATYGRGAWRSPTQYNSAIWPLTIQNNEVTKIEIYPNPADRLITITGNIDQARLVDITGKTVKYTDSPTMDVSSIPNGIYILEIQKGTQYHHSRVMVQH